MAKNNIGQGPRVPQQIPTHSAETRDATPAAQVQERRFDPSQLDLPKKAKGSSSQRSVLHEVIQAGLTQLAKAQGWEAQDNALGVLVKAMGVSAHETKSPEMLPSEFQRLLREFAPDPAQHKQVREDAKRLVTLSVVALGTEGLSDLRKSDQEAQLAADVSQIQGALADVLRLPAEERDRILAKNQEALSWAAGVFSRGKKALDAGQMVAPARLDALVGILQIVGRYAQSPSDAA